MPYDTSDPGEKGKGVLRVFLANSLAEFPRVKTSAEKYKGAVIPIVFIALGAFIIPDSGLLG